MEPEIFLFKNLPIPYEILSISGKIVQFFVSNSQQKKGAKQHILSGCMNFNNIFSYTSQNSRKIWNLGTCKL